MSLRDFSAFHFSCLAFWLMASTAGAMTLVVGTTDFEPGHVTAVADADGRLVRSGTGFIAVGAFGDLDEAVIRAAAGSGEAMQEVLGRFQQLGAAQHFGLGHGLEHIDGVFQASVSAPTRAGDGLVGRPVFVVGGTESGIFIFKSELTFEADYPVASGSVDLWGDKLSRAGGLLVGALGDSLEVLELGASATSLRLSAVDGPGLDLSRFESTIVSPVEPLPTPEEVPFPPPVVAVESPVPAEPPTLIPPVVIDDPVSGGGGMEIAPDDGQPFEWVVSPGWQQEIELTLWNGGTWLEDGLVSDWDRLMVSDNWVYQTRVTSFGLNAGNFAAGGELRFAVPEPGALILLAGSGIMVLRRSRSKVTLRAT